MYCGISKVAVAVVLALLASSGAVAGTLSTASGNVLVSKGNGFSAGFAGQALAAGDRVMIGQGGGQATITYDLNCVVSVDQGKIVTVADGNPCNAPGAQTQPAPVGTGVSPAMIAVGVGVAAAVGVAVWAASDGKSP